MNTSSRLALTALSMRFFSAKAHHLTWLADTS